MKMYKKLKKKIESKRNSKNIFFKTAVFIKDLLWRVNKINKTNKINPSFPIDNLRVYSINNPKIRIGKNNDGGYVILDGFTYDFLIGCGIGRDNSFEIEFADKYNVEGHAFDGTIENLPKPHKKIKFFKKNISNKNNESETNLHKLIKEYSNIFLKMDIEEGEYPWIRSLNKDQLNKFKQIVIEFHRPFIKERWDCIKKLTETHYLVHFHPNNCCGVSLFEKIRVPNVFECTFIRKKDIKSEISFNKESIPSRLDIKNISNREEINLQGYPYTQNKL